MNGWITVKNWQVRKDSERSATIAALYRAGLVDHPIKYDDGRIVYDWPERCPKYIKDYVAKLLGGNQ